MFAILIGSQVQGTWVDYAVAFLLILFFGIPHGATDHALTNWIKSKKVDARPTSRFLVSYNLVILLYAVLWFYVPSMALLIFLLVSAFHFGETQFLQIRLQRSAKRLLELSWGWSVLAIILFSDFGYLASLTVPYLMDAEVLSWIEANQAFLLYVPVAMALGISLFVHWKLMVKELIELGLIVVIAMNTSLLFSFAIFFAFWHSRDAVVHQIVKFRRGQAGFAWQSWARLSLPFTLLSLAGMAILIASFYLFSVDIPLITAFFVLVALITLPHVIVMSRFYNVQ